MPQDFSHEIQVPVSRSQQRTIRMPSTSDRQYVLILVNDQHDEQFLYFIIRLLQSSTCFEQRRAHHQEVKFY